MNTLLNKLKPVLYILMTSFLLTVFGCSKNSNPVSSDNNPTPRTSIPSNIAKEWYYGSISSTNFFNSSTGQFSSPSGTGMYFKFSEDGYYEKGVLLQSSLYGCSSTFYAFNKGTVVLEGNKITLYPSYGKIKSQDNCVSENNYEKPDQMNNEILFYELGLDEYNIETLWLRYENSDPSAFHKK